MGHRFHQLHLRFVFAVTLALAAIAGAALPP